jgi:DNA (cytosine-5)-methyltransferase 1
MRKPQPQPEFVSLEQLYPFHSCDGVPDFTFIDLFAGIGGFRLALQANKGQCVFSSEWDKFSQQTYQANYGDKPAGDITQIPLDEIPDHDFLTGGFPCQPFSLAGVSKKKSLGREHGFKDKTQGTLFFDVARILEHKKPKMFLLENVKNLKSHDKGNTFSVIEGTLKELGYHVFYEIIDAQKWTPQHRERIFIAGFHRDYFGDDFMFELPDKPDREPKMEEVLSDKFDPKYILSDKLWNYLQNYAAKHKAKGNGFGFGLVNKNSVSRTLSARYHKDGSEILVDLGKKSNPRRLTPRECAKLMGFPDDFRLPCSDTQTYRQFGNAVVVPVVKYVAAAMVKEYLKIKNG